MTDRERCQLHGPISHVRVERASVDPLTSDWGPAKQGPTSTFDRDGREEGRVRDEGVTITTRDASGLRTTVGSGPPRIRRQAGLEYGVGMDGTIRFDVLTRYDRSDRPVEVVYRNPEQQALHRILLAYDDQDRIVREQVLMGDVFGGAYSTTMESSDPAEPPSAEQIQDLAAMFKMVMPDGVFMVREYEYDERGRVAQLVERMAPASEHRRTFAYDNRDNIIEERYQSSDREASVDGGGRLVTSNETTHESWTRYEYHYDEHGNWIEKITILRVAPDRDFHRSNIERRTISYYDPPLHPSGSAHP